MKTKQHNAQKGFVPIIVIGIIFVLALSGTGGYFYIKQYQSPTHDAKEKIHNDSESPIIALEVAKDQRDKTSPLKSKSLPKKAIESIPSLFQGLGNSSSNNSLVDRNRPGWEILSEKERATLPDCKNPLMTISPVPLDTITNIEPVGSTNPPEHTLASVSTDTYISVKGQGTIETTPLVAPGDMWILLIKPRYGLATGDPEDHVIKYAFCKDVYGIVDHVKSFSAEMKALVNSYKCSNPADEPGSNTCPVLLMAPVKAGTLLGTVGRMQGNFNFGTWDLRTNHQFANPSRHGFLTKHSTCPFDYFSSPLKEQLMAKITETANGCGSVEHDIAGTLQGDWFIGNASPTRPADWGKLLHFGSSNRFSGQSVISISGIFVSKPTKWLFVPMASGNTNRAFKDVKPGSLYCYDNDGYHAYKNYEKGIVNGRIIVELTNSTTLVIEHQEGLCSTPGWEFKNSTTYIR